MSSWLPRSWLERDLAALNTLGRQNGFAYALRCRSIRSEIRGGDPDLIALLKDTAWGARTESVGEHSALVSALQVGAVADYGELLLFGSSLDEARTELAEQILLGVLRAREDFREAREKLATHHEIRARLPAFHVKVSEHLEREDLGTVLLEPLEAETSADGALLYAMSRSEEFRLAAHRGRGLGLKNQPHRHLVSRAYEDLSKDRERPFVLFSSKEHDLPAAFRSAVVLPLRFGSRILGLAWLLARKAGALTKTDAENASLWSDELAWALFLRGEFLVRRMSEESGTSETEIRLRRMITGDQRVTQELREQVLLAAGSSRPVLLSGETGTGKEVTARAIHDLSSRCNGPFVAIDCPALSENLLESELFGHSRGSFTGADRERAGLFLSAHGGTVFLDEVHNMSPSLQAKLLRVLETSKVRRVGDDQLRDTDVRVIAASNRDLQVEVKEGRFRQDLMFRLDVLRITVPALRERRDDIPLLCDRFLTQLSDSTRPVRIHPSAMTAMKSYGWPGNIRELKNVLDRAIVSSKDGEIMPNDLQLGAPLTSTLAESASIGGHLYDDIVDGGLSFFDIVVRPYRKHDVTRSEVRSVLDRALNETAGNYAEAARKLNVPKSKYQAFMDFVRNNKVGPT